MLYPYLRFADGTQVTHSHLIIDGNSEKIEVHFERPEENGFSVARCQLPDYIWLKCSGFSQEKIAEFEQFLKYNQHLIYKYAAEGGLKIA